MRIERHFKPVKKSHISAAIRQFLLALHFYCIVYPPVSSDLADLGFTFTCSQNSPELCLLYEC